MPLFFGCDGLTIFSIGSLSYGMYAFTLPSRMIARLKPRVPPNSPAELCILDLIRAWALFCVALGAMGLVVLEGNQRQQRCAKVGLVSFAWDWHLMKSKHWGAEAFLMVNTAANTANALPPVQDCCSSRWILNYERGKVETGDCSFIRWAERSALQTSSIFQIYHS